MGDKTTPSAEAVDNFGWPIRMIDGERACTRPCCKSEEFRIDGFCSIYCRDMYDEEQEVATLRAALAEIEKGGNHEPT